MFLGAIATTAIVSAQDAKAAIIIDVTESGGNVNAVLNGSAIIDDLFLAANWNDPAIVVNSDFTSRLWVGGGTGNFQAWSGAGMSGPSSFVVGGPTTITAADSGSGPLGGINVSASDSFGGDAGGAPPIGIGVPTGYVSGSPLSSTATWNGKTIADLGLAPGTYVWTWSVGGPNADSLTLNIAPEPTSFALGSLGLLGVIGRRRRLV
jgi:hypothetical protein